MKALEKKLLNKSSVSLLMVGVITFTIIAGAALAVPVPVLALSAGGIKTTIASIVISLLMQVGFAPTDTSYLDKLNNAYGAESSIGTIEDCINKGLLIDDNGTLIDNGLENAIQNIPEYESLFLNDLFQTGEAAAGVAAASGAHNLMTTAINCGTLGTIGAFAGAASVGVGLGVLLSNVTTKLADYIKSGMQLTASEQIQNLAAQGYTVSEQNTSSFNGYTFTYFFPDNTYAYQYWADWVYIIRCIPESGFSGGEFGRYVIDGSGNISSGSSTAVPGQMVGDTVHKTTPVKGIPIFDNQLDTETESNIQQGNIVTPPNRYNYGVGAIGNQYYDKENDSFPGLTVIMPENKDMRPIDMDEYNNFVNTANDNYNNGINDENIQGQNFTDYFNDHIEDVVKNPEDPYTPSIPNTDTPTIPDQPDIPDKPTITNGDVDGSLVGTTEGLENVFPFCIPFDIYALLSGLSAERRAPSFHVPLGEDQFLDVDLHDYESAAEILRALELIAFIVGLAVATRSLIGAKG